MDQDELISALDAARFDKAATADLVRRLAEPGAAAVPGLLAVLHTVERHVFFALRDALRLIGPPAFDAALAARERAEDVPGRWELDHVLRAFDERCLDRYTAALGHPMEDVRRQALGGLENLGPAAAPAVLAVIPFLADRDRYVRHTATRTVRAIGPAAVPALGAVRRDGPGRLRRHALTALAVIGGEAALDERDVRAWERLVRIKVTEPDGVVHGDLPDHCWLAVPGETYEELFPAMGLHDRRPCTITMGLSAMGDDTATVTGEDGARRTAHRVFVTPELDGWRLVYADSLFHEEAWDHHDLVSRISARCGQAQFFYQDDHSDSMIWTLARGGEVHRGYWRYGEPEWTGEPMAWETPLTEGSPHDSGGPDHDEDPGASREWAVENAARALSLLPGDAGEETRVRGHGWLAVTRPGIGHGPFTGALRI
ncbi:HEAT repeat domain-containing protein [Streptomyces lavendulocolor]|uniref:HEAT repeat domain-containing protein n=1 Tax=Streptomyces lavendulocolor TaxID=67316 RepID=UPI003C2AF4FE